MVTDAKPHHKTVTAHIIPNLILAFFSVFFSDRTIFDYEVKKNEYFAVFLYKELIKPNNGQCWV